MDADFTGMQTVLCCEDSMEGILTAVYEAYVCRQKGEAVRVAVGDRQEPQLFCSYRRVEAETEKVEKVLQTLRRELGEEAYLAIWRAGCSCRPEKGEAIYQTVVLGLIGRDGQKKPVGG